MWVGGGRGNFGRWRGVEVAMGKLGRTLLLIVAVTACGSSELGTEPGGPPGSDTVTGTADSVAAIASPNPDATECGASPVTAAMLSEAQFAFIGTVTKVEAAIHPWDVDPENPARPEVPIPKPWVTFDVERWYLNDWGTTFPVWIPDIAVTVGQHVAVGGNAYHTEVNGFSGQSGEVEFCAPASDGESLSAWDEQFGRASPPTAPPTTLVLPATKEFGDHSEPCAPTVLTNGDDDRRILSDGVDCFLAEYDAGRPVVWDVSVPTVEGDPIVSRYDFDGTTTIITTDYSFDHFGSGGVTEEHCTGVVPTDWLPRGTGCSTSTGEGFREDSVR